MTKLTDIRTLRVRGERLGALDIQGVDLVALLDVAEAARALLTADESGDPWPPTAAKDLRAALAALDFDS